MFCNSDGVQENLLECKDSKKSFTASVVFTFKLIEKGVRYNIRNSAHHFGPPGIIVTSQPSASVLPMFVGWLVGHYYTVRPSMFYFLDSIYTRW